MIETFQLVLVWARENSDILGWIGLGTGLLSVLGILLCPHFVNRLPSDYFLVMREEVEGRQSPPRHSIVRTVLRNLLGILVFLTGVLLCFVPGQGLLTMLLGLLLLSFPGKHALVLRLVRHPSVGKTLNWIRRHGEVPEFELP